MLLSVTEIGTRNIISRRLGLRHEETNLNHVGTLEYIYASIAIPFDLATTTARRLLIHPHHIPCAVLDLLVRLVVVQTIRPTFVLDYDGLARHGSYRGRVLGV